MKKQRIKFLHWDSSDELQLWHYSAERTGDIGGRTPCLVIQVDGRAHANRIERALRQRRLLK